MPIRNSISKASDEAAAALRQQRIDERCKRYHPKVGDKLYTMRLGKRWHVIPEPAKTVRGITFGGAYEVRHGEYPDDFADIAHNLCLDCFPGER